ncbi:MAG TPA: NmrA family NAD(P)-binding protein [Tepidisphaeraceae bacterium]|nr:NmrA family NAD(P)-binding protein [Tepidisphaeraceae bacterium]
MRIAITGPTGNVGRKLVHELLKQGQRDLVLLARDPDKLIEERSRGATIAHGDLTEQDFVIDAFRGVDAVFWLVPSNPYAPNLRTYQDEIARIGAHAAKVNGVSHVVLLSSLGADQPEGTGPILGLRDAEQLFRMAVPSLTILRPALFMENLLMQLETIRQESSIFLPISGNIPLPMIATDDIAKTAAQTLLETPPNGVRIITLVGPKHYSFEEAASIIGQTIGQPVHYVRISDEQAREALQGQGTSRDVADQIVEMYDGIDHGRLRQPLPPDALTTPTTFEQFAQNALRPALAPS